MTAVAWDGKILASDRMITWGNKTYEGSKIQEWEKYTISFCGSLAEARKLVRWFKAGARIDEFPENKKGSIMFVVDKENGLRIWQDDGEPFVRGFVPWATGCGEEYILGAMKAGANAIRAVEIANEYSPGCGYGVDHKVIIKTKKAKKKSNAKA